MANETTRSALWLQLLLLAVLVGGYGKRVHATPMTVVVVAPPPTVNLRGGPMVAFAMGGAYDAGLQIGYGLPVGRPWIQLAPFVAAGVRAPSSDLNYVAGVVASYGKTHRAAVSTQVGRLGSESLSLHGTRVDRRALHGAILGAGYEYLSPAGALLRVMLESRFTPGTRFHADEWATDFDISLAIGQRF